MFQVEHVLSGIDTLNISLRILWHSPCFLDRLRQQLEEAKKHGTEIPFLFSGQGDGEHMSFMLKPHGSQGYTWLLVSNDYVLKVMDWMTPKSTRPSIFIELKSELLWRLGPVEAVRRIQEALESQGAFILEAKPSRADLCMDVLFPEEAWNHELLTDMVTYAASDAAYRKNKTLTGITIGKNKLAARMYDKVKEIETVSGKTWFYDIWGFESVPEGQLVIRVEFQIMRDVLRELGMNDMGTFFKGLPHVWAYCTEKWLQFQDNPGKHHVQRETLPWWQTVQSSFLGVQDGEPLIRAKAIENDATRLRQQLTGLGTGIIALRHEAGEEEACLMVQPKDLGETAEEAVLLLGKTGLDLQEDVEKKLCKRSRLREKKVIAEMQRERLGLSPKSTGGGANDGTS